MKSNSFGWGIWLKDEREWAALPPRLCKPTPHNCNLVPAFIDVLRELVEAGHEPELKRIPKDTLAAMRESRKDSK